MTEIFGCKVISTWFAVVCCMCKKTLELKPTEEAHMLMETSHTYCETCGAKMMEEINAS